MTFNSQIHLRGVRSPLLVSKSNAAAIQTMLDDKTLEDSHVVRIGNYTFRKGDVKYVEATADGYGTESNDEYMRKQSQDELANRAKLVALTPTQKAHNTDMFFYLYKFSVGYAPTEEILNQARNIQERFFIENPKRTVCDPMKLKQIIPLVHGKKTTIWEQGYFRFVEAAVLRDMQLT